MLFYIFGSTFKGRIFVLIVGPCYKASYVKLDERRFTISSKALPELVWMATSTQAGPGPYPKVNLLCGKFSRAVACVWLFARCS